MTFFVISFFAHLKIGLFGAEGTWKHSVPS